MRRLVSYRDHRLLAIVVLAALLIVTVALAGCGSSTETETTAISTQTTTAAPTTAPPATGGTSSSETALTSAAGPATGTPYKIGVLTNTSGDLGFLGGFIVDTSKLQVEMINANGGINGHPLELVIEDDGYDQTKAVAGFTKLAGDPSILAVTGTMASVLLPSLQGLAEQNEMPYVATCPSLPDLRALDPKWTFCVGADEILNAAGILEIVQAKGYKNILCISHVDPNSESVVNAFVQQATAAGLKATYLADKVEIGTVDITPQVNKLKALYDKQGGDCVVSVVWPNLAGTLVKTMTSVGLDLPVVAYSLNADSSTLQMGGEELNGVMVPGPKITAVSWLLDSDPQKAVLADFVSRYQAKYNRAPGQVDANAADGILWIAAAFKAAGPDPTRATLRDALASVKDLVGPTGIRTMGKAGDNSGLQPGLFTPMIIQDQQFKELKLQ